MKRRSGESGFAMLLVFAMAAAVGILLYMELPRAAFEAQRHRELLLIDRGEQYQRAIQLYFRKIRRFPANLEQLENTNNYRFLRRRYRDPITGKDEWRLIHIGPGGMLTDSVTQKPPELQKGSEQAQATTGDPAQPGAAELPSAVARRRASEMSGPGLPGSVPPGGMTQPGAQQPGQYATNPDRPEAYPTAGQPYPPAQTFPPEPGREPQVGATYVVPGQPGSYQTSMPGQPGAVPSYQPGQPVPVPGIQPGQVYPVVQPGQPYPSTQPGQPYPVMQPGQPYQMVQPGQPYQVVQPGQPYQVVQPGQPYPQPYQPYPVTPPVQTGTQPFQPQSPVRIAPGQPPPGFIQGLLSPGRPGAFSPNVPQQGLPASSQTGGQSPMPYQYPPGTVPSVPAQPAGGGATNPALEMIRKILTTPRPGGLGEAQVQQTFTFGAGIAGVASKAEAPSIIIYNERDRYNEWEFIYDLRKDRMMVGPAGTIGGQPGMMLQPPPGSSTTMTPPQSPAPPPVGPGGRGR